MKKILITQSDYIPWKGYFDAINSVDEIILYDDMQYTKRDWRNRNRIKTPNGLRWISIPVKVKGLYYQKINETEISDKHWNINHWDIIKQNYAKAKYFNEFKALFEQLYLDCHETHLSRINYRFLTEICKIFGIKTKFHWSSEFQLKGDKSEKLLNICIESKADVYYSGPAAKEYMDVELFNEKGIKVQWLDYSGYPEYDQLYPPFEHSVSIIDLIFNTGKNAPQFLKSFKAS